MCISNFAISIGKLLVFVEPSSRLYRKTNNKKKHHGRWTNIYYRCYSLPNYVYYGNISVSFFLFVIKLIFSYYFTYVYQLSCRWYVARVSSDYMTNIMQNDRFSMRFNFECNQKNINKIISQDKMDRLQLQRIHQAFIQSKMEFNFNQNMVSELLETHKFKYY